MTTLRKNPEFFSRNIGHYIDTVGSAGRHTSKVAIDKITLCSRVGFHLMAIKLVIFSRLSDVFLCSTRTQLTHFDLTSVVDHNHMSHVRFTLQRTRKDVVPKGPIM